MSENTPTLVDGIRQQIEAAGRRMHTAIPARVETYDSARQECSVQPLIMAGDIGEDGARTPEQLPVIPGVPVVFQGAGGFGITFPVNPGDTVLLVFSEASLDKWLTRGGVTDPDDDRRFHLSDAVAIPGIRPFSNPTAQVAAGAMVIAGDEVRIGSKDASEFVALQSELLALRNWAAGHEHPVIGGGGGTAEASLPAPGTPSGATKVKVE